MRIQSLGEMESIQPNHFCKLINHYNLLVHGISATHKLLGGGDAEAQMTYQADLLKSMHETPDSDSDDRDQDKGSEQGDNGGHGNNEESGG